MKHVSVYFTEIVMVERLGEKSFNGWNTLVTEILKIGVLRKTGPRPDRAYAAMVIVIVTVMVMAMNVMTMMIIGVVCSDSHSRSKLGPSTAESPRRSSIILVLVATQCRLPNDRLVGLVVKASASRAADLGSHVRRGSFSRSSHTSDLQIGRTVAILPVAWHYRVSAGTGWPSVSILR